jgi:hypothetical protein
MPVALTPDETWDFQLIEDRKPDGTLDPSKTIFQCGALTPQDDADILDTEFAISRGTTGAGQLEQYRFGTRNLLACLRGLRGWRNFTDASGALIPFKTIAMGQRMLCDPANLAFLSLAHRTELALAIVARSKVTVNEGN